MSLLTKTLALLIILLCATPSWAETTDSEVFIDPAYAEIDRFESFNRDMFWFNERLDKYAAKPLAKAYRFVTPGFVDKGVTNFFNNLDELETFVNSIFQAKLHNSMVSLNRFIYNTTFGLLGFIDVATPMGLQATEEDFGQTLGYWGYEESTYLVLPLLGPSTARDFGGTFVDAYANPLAYADGLTTTERLAITGLEIVDKRADLLAAEALLFKEDPYAFMRSAYLQNRAFLINDGEVEDPFAEDDVDYENF